MFHDLILICNHMSYLFWLLIVGSMVAYSLYVGDAVVKLRSDLAGIRGQLSAILARLPSSHASTTDDQSGQDDV